MDADQKTLELDMDAPRRSWRPANPVPRTLSDDIPTTNHPETMSGLDGLGWPTNNDKPESGGDCPSASCCRSFDVKPMGAVTISRNGYIQKLEAERDALRISATNNAIAAGDLASDLQRLRTAVRNLRDVSGQHHSEIATKRLFALLPENP